ncbi:MAG TPA: BMP family ABC transporter substrate-binding protein [Rubrobacter sp.]
MRTRMIVITLALVLSLAAVGCGGSSGGSGGGSQGGADVRPGLVLDVGGLGDQGFNDSAYAGFKRAEKDLGVKGDFLESTAPTDYADNLTQLAENGFDPVIAVGFLMTEDLTQVSKQFPDTQFAIVDSVVDTPNTMDLVFREQEGSYLAGIVAGLMTQEKTEYTNPDDKVVGFLGGQTGPLIEKFQAGYEAGVKSVCPDCKVLVNYAGATPDAFNDPAKGKEISLQQINQGADIIYHAAGNTGAGLFDAASQEKIFAIGVDLDQAKLFPKDPILTSVVKRVDNAVYQTIDSVSKGEKPKGTTVDRGLKEKGISLAPFGRFDSMVPQKVKDEVEKAKKGIISGDIKVPDKVQ